MEVISAHICCASLGLAAEKLIKNAGTAPFFFSKSVVCVLVVELGDSPAGGGGLVLTVTFFLSSSTNCSIGTLPIWDENNPYRSISGCKRVRLRILSCIVAKRWFNCTVSTGLTKLSGTCWCSTRTIAVDV